MKTRLILCLFTLLLSCISSAAQQSQPPMQPLTFWYEYTVNPGKEDEFLDLVKTVGQPVRDKLMADGVVMAWGVETPLLRVPGNATHMIWYAVNDYAGLEKVDTAMHAQLRLLIQAGNPLVSVVSHDEEGVTEVVRWAAEQLGLPLFEWSVTTGLAQTLPAPGDPGVKPGKAADYRKAWEKYNKPVFEKLAADGIVMAYGLSVEEIRTDGDFTHFVWYAVKDLASLDKVRAAFMADRDRRSQEEQDSLTGLFVGLQDVDASRSEVVRSLIFHVPAAK